MKSAGLDPVPQVPHAAVEALRAGRDEPLTDAAGQRRQTAADQDRVQNSWISSTSPAANAAPAAGSNAAANRVRGAETSVSVVEYPILSAEPAVLVGEEPVQ